MDPDFEDHLRRTLHGASSGGSPDPVDVDAFLSDVHRGVRRRRRRRAITTGAAAVVLLAGGGYVVAVSGALDDQRTPMADDTNQATRQTREPTQATTSARSPAGTSGTAGPATTRATGAPATAEQQPPGQRAGEASPRVRADLASPFPLSDVGQLRASKVDPLSVTATGTEYQWVLASTPGQDCDVDRCATLFETSDAGGTWVTLGQLPVPAGSEGDTQSANQVRFAGENGPDGWAFDGILLSTHDAGETWVQPELPVDGVVTRLEAWGDHVYAVVDGDGVNLVRSPVASDQWQVVADVPAGLSFVSALAMSSDVVALLDTAVGDEGNRLLLSTDGTTFAERQPCDSGLSPESLSTAGDHLWVECTDGTATVVVSSDDAGQSWVQARGTFRGGELYVAGRSDDALVTGPAVDSIQRVAPNRPPEDLGVETASDVEFFGCTNPDVCYVLSASGDMIRTEDGGTTWARYSVEP